MSAPSWRRLQKRNASREVKKKKADAELPPQAAAMDQEKERKPRSQRKMLEPAREPGPEQPPGPAAVDPEKERKPRSQRKKLEPAREPGPEQPPKPPPRRSRLPFHPIRVNARKSHLLATPESMKWKSRLHAMSPEKERKPRSQRKKP